MIATVSLASRVDLCRRVVVTALSLVSVSAAQRPASPVAALRVVVIAGEDAVNIIQQKTAVAPIVEVRDRNDQPVAGAVVNFAIRSGRASFNGARTLSITTDAAGRAVASSLTPTAAGTLQISASAAFQGQTAATITIAQTNVLTAAQAAAIGSGGAGGAGAAGGAAGGGAGGGTSGATAGAAAGGAAGGGGGISGLTIGLLGAGVGAGTLVAVNAKDNSGSSGTAPPVSTPSPPPAPPSAPGPTFVLYDIVMVPAVTTIQQCPQAPANNGPGPVGTSVNFSSDGSFTGDLFSNVPAFRLVTMSGRWTPTDISGTIVCIGGGGPTGSLSGIGSTTRYTGAWNFGGLSGSFTLTPK